MRAHSRGEGHKWGCQLPFKVATSTMEKIVSSVDEHDAVLENALPLVLGTRHLVRSPILAPCQVAVV